MTYHNISSRNVAVYLELHPWPEYNFNRSKATMAGKASCPLVEADDIDIVLPSKPVPVPACGMDGWMRCRRWGCDKSHLFTRAWRRRYFRSIAKSWLMCSNSAAWFGIANERRSTVDVDTGSLDFSAVDNDVSSIAGPGRLTNN